MGVQLKIVMSDDGVLNHSGCEALPSRMTIEYFNQFVVKMGTKLMYLSNLSENSFQIFHQKLHRLESALTLIEKKLDKEAFKNDENNQTVVIQNTSEKTEDKIERQVIASTSEIMTEVGMAEIEKDEVTPTVMDGNEFEIQEEQQQSILKVKDVPKLAQYFKMVRLGVPTNAVKLKMSRENINPDLLDDPEADAPDYLIVEE